MNPEYIAAGTIHTIPDKLSEYFLQPLTNVLVILVLIIMFVNIYMLKNLRKIKTKDYITLTNVITIGIYSVVSVISAVLVSRLGPHGTLAVDECDLTYMMIPRVLFYIVATINVICFVISIITKIKKDKEYKETLERGYYAEEKAKEIKEKHSAKSSEQKSIIDSISSFAEDIKEKMDLDSIKDKVNQVTEDVKDLINNRNNKE